jgi:hypothetical protein
MTRVARYGHGLRVMVATRARRDAHPILGGIDR